MTNLGWLDVTDIDFNALLLFEPLHVEYLAQQQPDKEMGTGLSANPAVAWYLKQTYPPITAYINNCLAMAAANPSPQQIRQAEIAVLNRVQDWLIYVLDPHKYDRLEFLNWDDSSLLEMADFKDKIVLDIGSGTGRLAFTVAHLAQVVYAIEPVSNLRRFILSESARRGLENVYPIDGRITQIPFPDNFTDFLMAGHVFGDCFEEEYDEMRRVVRNGGSILLHPGTSASGDQPAHRFLMTHGFNVSTFEEPGGGTKRKYWKTVKK